MTKIEKKHSLLGLVFFVLLDASFSFGGGLICPATALMEESDPKIVEGFETLVTLVSSMFADADAIVIFMRFNFSDRLDEIPRNLGKLPFTQKLIPHLIESNNLIPFLEFVATDKPGRAHQILPAIKFIEQNWTALQIFSARTTPTPQVPDLRYADQNPQLKEVLEKLEKLLLSVFVETSGIKQFMTLEFADRLSTISGDLAKGPFVRALLPYLIEKNQLIPTLTQLAASKPGRANDIRPLLDFLIINWDEFYRVHHLAFSAGPVAKLK